ncbi:MAG: LexA family protein [Candidatus Methylacidiphilales bacterium]|nr:hypothetical protein [Candidatus Methylacidiphilales bacterium]
MKTPTDRQGQFLAYIYQYSQIHGRAPAEKDMQDFFQITAPSVHSMVLMLEKNHFISRIPGMARSIQLLVPSDQLPQLKSVHKIKPSAPSPLLGLSEEKLLMLVKLRMLHEQEKAALRRVRAKTARKYPARPKDGE